VTDPDPLDTVRRRYARQMVADLPAPDPRIEAALATVPRERFVGPPPWTIVEPSEGRIRRTSDVTELYADALVQLDATRHVNNGSPSLHALMLHHLGVRPGDRVLHAGTGTGYYTAILSELVGPGGSVEAVEYDERLARATAENLRDRPNVTVRHGDSADYPQGEVDRIYVNFGLGAPALRWFEHLSDGGTLEFPLCVKNRERSGGGGAVILATRKRAGYAARFITNCSFVMAEGPLAGDAQSIRRLDAAFRRGHVEFVRSVRLRQEFPDRCWYWRPEWCFSYDEPPSA